MLVSSLIEKNRPLLRRLEEVVDLLSPLSAIWCMKDPLDAISKKELLEKRELVEIPKAFGEACYLIGSPTAMREEGSARYYYADNIHSSVKEMKALNKAHFKNGATHRSIYFLPFKVGDVLAILVTDSPLSAWVAERYFEATFEIWNEINVSKSDVLLVVQVQCAKYQEEYLSYFPADKEMWVYYHSDFELRFPFEKSLTPILFSFSTSFWNASIWSTKKESEIGHGIFHLSLESATKLLIKKDMLKENLVVAPYSLQTSYLQKKEEGLFTHRLKKTFSSSLNIGFPISLSRRFFTHHTLFFAAPYNVDGIPWWNEGTLPDELMRRADLTEWNIKRGAPLLSSQSRILICDRHLPSLDAGMPDGVPFLFNTLVTETTKIAKAHHFSSFSYAVIAAAVYHENGRWNPFGDLVVAEKILLSRFNFYYQEKDHFNIWNGYIFPANQVGPFIFDECEDSKLPFWKEHEKELRFLQSLEGLNRFWKDLIGMLFRK